MKEITIHGGRVHNLKNVTVSIPKNKLVVATGVSGSGKSSLVFDIIFEEGSKQYLQSLGILTEIDNENKFDKISGLSPTIAVQQNIIRQSNPRSTVGSRTSLFNLLTLLYSGEGQMNCSICREALDDKLFCKNCQEKEVRLEPSYFSPNSSDGMCLKCSGRGKYLEINIDQLLSTKEMTMEEVFKKAKVTPGYLAVLQRRFKKYMEWPFLELPQEIRNEAIYGRYENSKQTYSLTKLYQNRYQKGEEVESVYSMTVCPDCQGFRVGEEARKVWLNGKHIGEVGAMALTDLKRFFKELLSKQNLTQFGQNLLKEMIQKNDLLIKSKLGHLSLYREMNTLSGGELQRLFLNAHLDAKMDSLIYILDEPTSGLHESEKEMILEAINDLKGLGNSVIVVEHDKKTIKMAEHIIDIGPKAGVAGGDIIYQGSLQGLLDCENSITGQYLSGKKIIPERKTKKQMNQDLETKKLRICNAKANNLKDISVSIPLNRMIGIAGKSGSGKSSLISNTLLPCLKTYFRERRSREVKDVPEEIGDLPSVEKNTTHLEGTENIAGYSEIFQAPIGRNMNSNPATYIGIWDKIRQLFAQQPVAMKQGLGAGYFSFNSKGACLECTGSGIEKIWLGGDLSIDKICKTCAGKRFNQQSLAISYNGRNIYDVLEMSITDAVAFFQSHKNIVETLEVLEQIGMGYIKLGQPTPTLSGGESQRIKLAKELGKKRKGNILYILDEPTTGLSQYDTAKLIKLLDELIEKGNSVIVIEHDLEVLNSCDWLIELGPEGGMQGGTIVAEGTPVALKQNSDSITGGYL